MILFVYNVMLTLEFEAKILYYADYSNETSSALH